MAAQGLRASYEYETSPRKLQPEYEPKKNPYRRKKSSLKKAKKVNKKQVKKARYNYKPVIYVAVAFVMLFTISYRNSKITEEYNQKEV